jgi:Tol biopolymer transport system component
LPHFLRATAASRHSPKDRFLTSIPSNNKYIVDLKAITQGGTNAEAYFSFDNTKLTFQAQLDPYNITHPCDLIYNMNIDGSNQQLASPAKGRDTCSYFTKDGKYLIYSSTFDPVANTNAECPPVIDPSFGYTWPLQKSMSVYRMPLDGTMPGTPEPFPGIWSDEGYSAESVLAPNGEWFVFTSDVTGDLELYQMATNGTGHPRRLTNTLGYDGGAWPSFDSKMIAWRANRPPPRSAWLTSYLELLKHGQVEPVDMQIYYMMLDGPMQLFPIQVTNLTGVSFAPFFLPDDSGLIFSSNTHDPEGGNFQLYMVNLDGTNVTRLTDPTTSSFTSFPMFSYPSGKDEDPMIVFCSDLGGLPQGQIDVFVGRWIGPGSKTYREQQAAETAAADARLL